MDIVWILSRPVHGRRLFTRYIWELRYFIFEINCFSLPHFTLDEPIFIKWFCSNKLLFNFLREWSLDLNFALDTKPEGHNNWKRWQRQTWLVWMVGGRKRPPAACCSECSPPCLQLLDLTSDPADVNLTNFRIRDYSFQVMNIESWPLVCEQVFTCLS